MASTIDPEELHSDHVLAGFEYWSAKKGDRALPARADFDPLIEVPSLVPHLMVKDVRRDPLDFRHRLIGTALRRHVREDLTGKWMSEIDFQRKGNPIWEFHELAVSTGKPVFFRPDYIGPQHDFLQCEAVILPLAADHLHVDALFVFVGFFAPHNKTGTTHAFPAI